MANVFTQSGEKAISLFRKHLLKTQLTLALFYFIVAAIMLGISGEITRLVFIERVKQQFEQTTESAVRRGPPTAAAVRDELRKTTLVVNGALLTLAGITGFFLAGITLEPLKKSYEKEQQFLSDASHELRTPLSILRTSLENLHAKIDHAHKQEIKENIEEVDRMHHLIQNLLTLSRTEQQTLPMKNIPLIPLITGITERMQKIAEKKDQHIITEKNTDDIAILGNSSALEQALTNVMENAILYNHTKGIMTVCIAKNNNYAQITIKDTGIGMSEEDIARSTERFYRGEKSRNRAQGGSGLGLAIVKQIVTLHKGTLTIHSEPEKGTTVILSFPIHKAS